MSILERTREIGIMKAIGAEDREIKLIFFFEAAVIGLTGGIIGSLAAWGIDALANRLAYRFILKPQGASFVDFFSLPPYLGSVRSCSRWCFDFGRFVSGGARGAHRSSKGVEA